MSTNSSTPARRGQQLPPALRKIKRVRITPPKFTLKDLEKACDRFITRLQQRGVWVNAMPTPCSVSTIITEVAYDLRYELALMVGVGVAQ